MSKVLPQMDSICNFPSKDAQLNVELTPDLLDEMIEQYKGYYRTLSAITQDLKDSFAALFNGLPDSQVETICNKKLSLPDGTKSTPHDLLRMVQFEGVMAYARDFSTSSEDLALKMKDKEFYGTHLARIVDEEYEMQWRVALEGEVGKCASLNVANNAGRALFGLSKGRVKFPLAITSFSDLQHTLNALVEFIIQKNCSLEGGPQLRSRQRLTWQTNPTLALVQEFLQSKPGVLPPCGEGGKRDEADAQAGNQIDYHQFDASSDPVDDCWNDCIAAAPDPVQWLTHKKIELRKQKKDVDPKAADQSSSDPVDDCWNDCIATAPDPVQRLTHEKIELRKQKKDGNDCIAAAPVPG